MHTNGVRVFAPAKINLSLHITGRRADGYHFLDSLVVFADIGDSVRIEPASVQSFSVDGPESEGLETGGTNLVLRAADMFETCQTYRYHLEKNLPVASGIGGGSADAAAICRGLAALESRHIPDMISLGADVPICIASKAARMEGIGERITPLSELPLLHAVLVNPRCQVSTKDIFLRIENPNGAPMPKSLPKFSNSDDMSKWLSAQRNDMEAPAVMVAPQIMDAKQSIAAQNGCLIARMSGSGATCFGIFANAALAEQGAARISRAFPDWWVKPTQLGTQSPRAAAQVI